MKPVPLLLLLALLSPPAFAGMYKCRGDQGAVLYQDGPCPPGRELRNFDTDPANVSVVPGTPTTAAGTPRNSAVARDLAQRQSAFRGKAPARHAHRSGDPGERRHIASGMAAGEVMARIGKPDLTSGGRKGKTWVYFPAAGDESTLTTLSVAGGKVVEVERKVMR